MKMRRTSELVSLPLSVGVSVISYHTPKQSSE